MREEDKQVDIGLDVGSVSLNTVLLDSSGAILEDHYTRMKGQPVGTVREVLEDILQRYPRERIGRVGVTGSGGKLVTELLN